MTIGAAEQLGLDHFDGGQNVQPELQKDHLVEILNTMKAAKAAPVVDSADEAAIRIAPATAVKGERVLYDPTAGAFLLTAPPSPKPGDIFGIKNVTTHAVNGVTVSGNGQTIEDPGTPGGQTGTTAAVVAAGNAKTWQFLKTATTTGWFLV